MTLAAIKGMFRPGQRWQATRTGPGKHRDEVREVYGSRSRDLVWRLTDGSFYHTEWPKASEVQEARPGFLQFQYSDLPGVVVTLTAV